MPERGLVLDPFFGIGTAVLVAVENRRQALGCEIAEKYAKAAQKALCQASPALF